MTDDSEGLILPDPLPALDDPAYNDQPGPYSVSGLKTVTGNRINPDCRSYARRELMTKPGFGMRSAAHTHMEIFLNEVGGYDPRTRINQPPASELPLSAVIPRLSLRGEKLPYPLRKGSYIVDYPSINSNPRKLPERAWAPRLRDRFEDDTQLLLSFFGNHKVVRGLWTMTEFWYHPFISQFDAILLPDFSAFSNDSWPQSLHGERMHQIFGEEGSAAGVNVIPSLAWAGEESLRRQVELYVSQYPRINTIHVDCYGSNVDRVGWIWRWLYALEKYCAPHTHIRWLISGITTGWGIRELNELFPSKNYHLIMSVSGYVNSMVGSTDPNFQAREYRKKIATLEDMYTGDVVADKIPRPTEWPQFWQLLKSDTNIIRKKVETRRASADSDPDPGPS